MLQRENECSEALFWFEKADEQGIPSSTFVLGQLWECGFMAAHGRFVRDLDKALEYYDKAAKAGFAPAFARRDILQSGAHQA